MFFALLCGSKSEKIYGKMILTAYLILTFLFCDHVSSDVVYVTTVHSRKVKRSSEESGSELKIRWSTSGESNEFSLVLRKNDLLVTESTVVEWHHNNGSKTTEALSQLQDRSSCFYIGQQVRI